MPDTAEPTFTKAEVLAFLEKASEMTGRNLHGVLDKIDPRLAVAEPLPDAAKPDKSGKGSLVIALPPHTA